MRRKRKTKKDDTPPNCQICGDEYCITGSLEQNAFAYHYGEGLGLMGYTSCFQLPLTTLDASK